ncbi:MAG: cell division protein FtsZ [Candidatus Marinimicrobia bacterium]|nr:cell division protein FtsZ [Candidatus Neomarinimicrobiota bacterium]MBL7023289.1 cell division protein FtsZ [Candidatus Neomarinimicrobiota bacterium]MBL7108883.1 cell division protein FtsZ [Candidatus Neomarinimicrobiota bacterium]
MLFEPVDLKDQKARIVVLGVGGAGGNALNRMIEDNLSNVEFVAINTDAQDLEINNAQTKLQIGKELTKGLGAGADSNVGQRAAEENKEAITKTLDGADMVFITAGMGGGTGTGATPVIAQLAKECGALTVGVITKPFFFEGPKRTKRALEGIKELKKNCDTLLMIPNETLLSITELNTTVVESFKLADSVLHQATKGIADLLNVPGLINLDFADVRTVMENMGDALMGTGIAHGEERAILAAQQAINSPLLQDVCIRGAKGLLVNITGPQDMGIHELNDASNIIYEEAGDGANIFLGCVLDPDLTDEIRVTVIATGLNQDGDVEQKPLVDLKFNAPEKDISEEEFSIPTYERKQIENSSCVGTPKEHIEDNKEEEPIVFGEEYDNVPAFIRNRNIL